jgi:hypothetical protein
MTHNRLVILAAALAANAAACATMFGHDTKKWPLESAERVPAASGQISVATGDQGNNTVTVKVEHLARPSEAFPGTTTYVVWLVPSDDQRPQNVGALQVGSDLKGELKTQTPFRAFQIIVTAESEPNVTAPSGNRAMRAAIAVPG